MDLQVRTKNHWRTKEITNESKTQVVQKIFTKTIGQSHKNHQLISETVI